MEVRSLQGRVEGGKNALASLATLGRGKVTESVISPKRPSGPCTGGGSRTDLEVDAPEAVPQTPPNTCNRKGGQEDSGPKEGEYSLETRGGEGFSRTWAK